MPQLDAISRRLCSFIETHHTGAFISCEPLYFYNMVSGLNPHRVFPYCRLSGQLSTLVNKPFIPEGLCPHDSAVEAQQLLLTLSSFDTLNFLFIWFASFGGRVMSLNLSHNPPPSSSSSVGGQQRTDLVLLSTGDTSELQG